MAQGDPTHPRSRSPRGPCHQRAGPIAPNAVGLRKRRFDGALDVVDGPQRSPAPEDASAPLLQAPLYSGCIGRGGRGGSRGGGHPPPPTPYGRAPNTTPSERRRKAPPPLSRAARERDPGVVGMPCTHRQAGGWGQAAPCPGPLQNPLALEGPPTKATHQDVDSPSPSGKDPLQCSPQVPQGRGASKGPPGYGIPPWGPIPSREPLGTAAPAGGGGEVPTWEM